MKHVSIVLLIVMVGMASCAINREKEMSEISGAPSFQPKPLDDEWSKWLKARVNSREIKKSWNGSGSPKVNGLFQA